MRKIYIEAYEYAESSNPVLILGESGSGKEVLAEHIHHMSPRNDKPFVAINTAAIPKDLLESELFGHERGAYTGAAATRKGRFEQAEGGTLFLDEIGDMPADLQTRLLRVLNNGIFYRVGGNQPITANVRIITATHQNLGERIKQGLFREDLLYRINLAPIVIPPLREHRDDILPLAQAMLRKAMGHDKKGIIFSEKARNKLGMYDFPGNVRELGNIIERLVAKTGNNREISAEDIELAIASGGTAKTVTQGSASSDMQLPTATAQGNVEIAAPSTMQSPTQPNITLANLHEIIASLPVEKDDPALQGIKPRVESAIQDLMQRCAGAALERCKKPMNDKYELQPALQLIFDDKELVQTSCYRELDKILGRPQKTTSLNQDDLKALVEIWKSAKRPS